MKYRVTVYIEVKCLTEHKGGSVEIWTGNTVL